jgi:hypothetical protein
MYTYPTVLSKRHSVSLLFSSSLYFQICHIASPQCYSQYIYSIHHSLQQQSSRIGGLVVKLAVAILLQDPTRLAPGSSTFFLPLKSG